MRSLWFGVLLCAALIAACGDDDSDFAVRPSDGSSSSKVTEPAEMTTGTMTDSRDGQTYKTVKIGDQWWMAENLNYEVDSSFCYDGDATNCTKYGRLYEWSAAVGKAASECGYGNTCSLPSGNIQGVCPEGWHLPNITEWETLFDAVGGQPTAGTVLKSSSGWNFSGNGTDDFGFSALPAVRSCGGDCDDMADLANFWSSTEYGSDAAFSMDLTSDYNAAYQSLEYKVNGFSVRCIQD